VGPLLGYGGDYMLLTGFARREAASFNNWLEQLAGTIGWNNWLELTKTAVLLFKFCCVIESLIRFISFSVAVLAAQPCR
jgi:hypothetical protein